MTGNAPFVMFWTGIVGGKSLPLPLQPFAVVVVLPCPSSCDAEGAISVLSRIVPIVRGSMSWGNIRMHLIAAEDVKAGGYPYDEFARAWQHMKRAPLVH